MSTEALRRAVGHLGSQRALAEHLGKSQAYISKWLNRDKKVPAEFCADIEAATGGKVTCQQLRPDVFRKPKKRSAA